MTHGTGAAPDTSLVPPTPDVTVAANWNQQYRRYYEHPVVSSETGPGAGGPSETSASLNHISTNQGPGGSSETSASLSHISTNQGPGGPSETSASLSDISTNQGPGCSSETDLSLNHY